MILTTGFMFVVLMICVKCLNCVNCVQCVICTRNVIPRVAQCKHDRCPRLHHQDTTEKFFPGFGLIYFRFVSSYTTITAFNFEVIHAKFHFINTSDSIFIMHAFHISSVTIHAVTNFLELVYVVFWCSTYRIFRLFFYALKSLMVKYKNWMVWLSVRLSVSVCVRLLHVGVPWVLTLFLQATRLLSLQP